MVAAHERVKRKPAACQTVKLAANGRHVKIRRYLARLKRSLRSATKWAVFDPTIRHSGRGCAALRQMTLDGSLLLLVHPHERLLHRVACAVEVLQDALGVLQERTLKPLKSGLNPRCLLFCSGGKHWRERPELHISTETQRFVFCI